MFILISSELKTEKSTFTLLPTTTAIRRNTPPRSALKYRLAQIRRFSRRSGNSNLVFPDRRRRTWPFGTAAPGDSRDEPPAPIVIYSSRGFQQGRDQAVGGVFLGFEGRLEFQVPQGLAGFRTDGGQFQVGKLL